jgi:hypothetical protein
VEGLVHQTGMVGGESVGFAGAGGGGTGVAGGCHLMVHQMWGGDKAVMSERTLARALAVVFGDYSEG